MEGRFDYFIVLADMRTGSNFLEANLNAFPDLSCLGELFNPYFVGYPNKDAALGFDQAKRDFDPGQLVAAVAAQPDLAGFRFFSDHDTRVFDIAMADPRCAKVVLTRNPIDSYVSWKIAQETGQWKLTNVTRRKAARAYFDGDEFARHVDALQGFQLRIQSALQVSGQTGFYLSYDDLQSLDVINGLAAWLGVSGRLDALDQSLKPQNPVATVEKVSNPQDVTTALARLDRFNLTRTPNFEPRRGPAAPTYVAGENAPLMFLPAPSGPEVEVLQWLAALDGVAPETLRTKMTQKDIRQWKRQHPGHRSFTVLRHPVARAHTAFCRKILVPGPGSFDKIRATLRRVFDLPIPSDAPDESYSRAAHRRAFLAFLEFVRANLAGQTAIRVDPAWSSQSTILQGFGEFAPVDFVWREEEWPDAAAALARQMGLQDVPAHKAQPDAPYALEDIYDDEIEALAKQIYQRDYMMFGFRTWRENAKR